MGFRLKFLILLPLLWAHLAFAGVEQISEKEFHDLAQELAPKVNLFREGWKKNPDAEFYGGTTRDYLYWLKGQFQNVHNSEQAKAELAKLRAMSTIDVRDFIIGDSDVDIISAEAGSLDAKQFGVRKIDFQSPDILDPATELGKNETLQGYIPAEKIRLGQKGFHPTGLGNGVKEIYEGKLSVHFASAADFAKSKYAQEGINHPILLALRFIRVQAINYFRTHGAGLPDKEILFNNMDAASAKNVRSVIEKAMQNGELDKYLEQQKFNSWINGAVQKSFRSYTNPTAALELMKHFGVDRLILKYPEKIESLNQYVFAKYRDQSAIRQALANSKVNEKEFYRSPSEFFPDGRLYHGTRTDEAFRGILLQGALPSEGGSGGQGLYGVGEPDKKFSEEWAEDKNRLLSFSVKSDAKIVDITQGEGARIFANSNLNEEDFAERFGADILAYPYVPRAFVVKNSAALEKPQGVYRKVMPLDALIKAAKSISSAEELANLIVANGLSSNEIAEVWRASRVKMSSVVAYLQQPPLDETKKHVFEMSYLQSQPEIQALIKKWLVLPENDARFTVMKEMLIGNNNPSDEQIKFIDSLFKEKAIIDNWEIQIGLLGIPLNDRRLVTPNATALALTALADPSGPASAHLSFLSKARLSAAEQERLWKIYDSPVFRAKAGANARVDLASGLLRNKKNIESVKADLLASTEEKFYPAKNKVRLLIDYFPEDPKVAEAFFSLLQKFQFAIIASEGGMKNYEDINKMYAALKNPDAVLKHREVLKNYFLVSASGKDLRELLAKRMLESYELTDDDWVLLLGKIRADTLIDTPLDKLRQLTNRGPELRQALLKAYDRVSWDSIVRERLREVIQADANPAFTQAYVTDALKKPFLHSQLGHEKVRKAIELLTEPPRLAQSPEVEEAIFEFLGKLGTTYFLKSRKKEFLNYLMVENPSTANRLQQLIVEGKIGKFRSEPETLLGLAERMPSISPEFSAYIQNSLNEADPTLLADSLKSYKARLEALNRKGKGSCPASFAAVGGTH